MSNCVEGIDCEDTDPCAGCTGCGGNCSGCSGCNECVECEQNVSDCVDQTSDLVLLAEQEDCGGRPCGSDDPTVPDCALVITAIVANGPSIILVAVNGFGPLEYSEDNVTWQTSATFPARPQTSVTYYVREVNRPTCSTNRSYGNFCIPNWRDMTPATYQCVDQIRQKKQIDGCGNERWVEDPAGWTVTNETRCV